MIDVDGLRLELSEQYQMLGRYDEALAVIDAAIAAGFSMRPDTRCLRAGHAGEHEVALGWLTDGLRLALRTGDPEQLVEQLAELRQDSLDHLGGPPTSCSSRPRNFCAAPSGPARHLSPRRRRSRSNTASSTRSCWRGFLPATTNAR